MNKTKEESLITKEAILQGAMKTFLHKGYSLTSLEDIARNCKVTRGAIYHHFKGKTEIYDLLVQNADESMRDLLENVLNEDLPPFVIIEKLIFSVVNNFYENKQFRDFIELTWFKRETDLKDKSSLNKKLMSDFFIKKVKQLLKLAVKQNTLSKNTNIDIISAQIICLIGGFYRGYYINPELFKSKEKTCKLFASYFNSITK